MVKRRITAFLLVTAFIFSCTLPLRASELDDKKAQLQNITKQIEAQKKLVNSQKKKEKTVINQLASLEKAMAKTQNEIKQLESRVNVVSNDIEATEEDIARAEAHLNQRSEALNKRLVQIYMAGEVSYLEVLFSSTDFSDFLTRWDLLNGIVNQDQSLIQSISAERDQLAAKKSHLEAAKKELETVKQTKAEKKEELNDQTKQKQSALKDISKQRKAYEQALSQLESDSRSIEQMIQKLQGNTGSYQGTGIFLWPAPDSHRITSDYGMRYHPILKERRMHTGMDIGARSGTPILAADSGKVIFAGSYGAYGNAVIIDHGGGISTLYGHMSVIMVKSGQSVTKGKQIGKVGSTGWTTGPHLHFEVRKNGSPVNPHSYVK
jgi:murein DD-endopeptidase MepM/ murein hydrolase activator NlpD